MSRIFWFIALPLLFLAPVPGLNFLIKNVSANDRPYQIKGRIMDSDSKEPMEFANVSLFHTPDTIPRLITATNLKGEFHFSNLPPGNYSILVHFMGFRDYRSMPFKVSGKPYTIELDPIQVQIDNIDIGEITVRGNSRKPSYQLDKKTIYVEDELSAAGGSASDLLRKLPTVTQSPDGKIAIHGNSNLLVFINGKPSSMKGNELLLNTSAAEIKKIELITSPSAKYDASGSGGIINLITKKSTIDGLNGNIQAGIDQLGGYSSDVLLNYKIRQINLYTGFDHNQRRNEGDVDYNTEYTDDHTIFTKTGLQEAQRINTGLRTGLDFVPSPEDKISVNGNAGSFETTNNGDWQAGTTTPPRNTPVNSIMSDSNTRKGKYGGADFSYDHKHDSLNKSISFSALWNTFKYDDNFQNQTSSLAGFELMNQNALINKVYNNFQANADFALPAGKSGILEFGYQMALNKENEDYNSELSFPPRPIVTTEETSFDEIIQAGYGTLQLKSRRLGFKFGLRAENLSRELKTLDNNYALDRFDFYPSFNSSFKIDSIQEIMLNYSRRTDHLKTIQLDPLPRWYDFYNVLVGNPELKNEITDKIALNYLLNFKKFTLSSEIYLYNISDKIDIIRSVYNNQSIQNRYENTGTERTMGLEFNAGWIPSSWFSLSEKLDFIDSNLDVTVAQIAGKKSYRQWYTVTTADFKITPTTLLEVDFSYYGPAMTAQSNIEQVYMCGIGFRQMFFDNKLTFTLTGRDVMGMYQKTEHVQGTEFNQMITARNNFPIRFSVSYKFNHYKRDERRVAKSPVIE
jgi:outer membrane receptor for ferrienterochelin and colicin